jgi:predicted ester cyclase
VSEQNKAAARLVFEVWTTGRVERLDGVVAPDVVHHDPYDPHAGDGLAGMKRTILTNRESFPDLETTVEDQFAEGDRVATRWSARMTPTNDPPSSHDVSAPATLRGITIDRFEDGKIVEAWRSMDMLGLLRSLEPPAGGAASRR